MKAQREIEGIAVLFL